MVKTDAFGELFDPSIDGGGKNAALGRAGARQGCLRFMQGQTQGEIPQLLCIVGVEFEAVNVLGWRLRIN